MLSQGARRLKDYNVRICSIFGTNSFSPLAGQLNKRYVLSCMTYSELLRALKTERKRVDRKIAEHLKLMVLRNGTRKKLESALRDLAS
jgi:hypothetical protein